MDQQVSAPICTIKQADCWQGGFYILFLISEYAKQFHNQKEDSPIYACFSDIVRSLNFHVTE